jgi:transcription elongation GreA/GreB family factor
MFTRKRARSLIRESDFRKLTSLETTESQNLATVVSQFDVTPDIEVADNVVGLGSIVSFTDVASGVTKTVQVVEPDETDATSLKISAFSLLGRVLIGLMPGDHIEWQLSQDIRRTLEIGVVKTPIRVKGSGDE